MGRQRVDKIGSEGGAKFSGVREVLIGGRGTGQTSILEGSDKRKNMLQHYGQKMSKGPVPPLDTLLGKLVSILFLKAPDFSIFRVFPDFLFLTF